MTIDKKKFSVHSVDWWEKDPLTDVLTGQNKIDENRGVVTEFCKDEILRLENCVVCCEWEV